MRVSLCVEFQVGGVAIKGNRFLSMALSGLRMQAPRRDLRRYRRRDALSVRTAIRAGDRETELAVFCLSLGPFDTCAVDADVSLLFRIGKVAADVTD